ncbi:MAG: ABC transporter ATP-binding protein [Clostridia bacterium]|nr:ABC transporter ATP-binding protein [Clostridia bacterium]
MIVLNRVGAGYDGEMRIRGISAELVPGKMTGIVGPNGCGKSTLLKTITGILAPMAGHIALSGRDLSRMPTRERARRIAFMPQSRSAPELTVQQLAAHGRYPHMGARRTLSADDRAIVERALTQAGALALRGQLVSRLSGGERQRAYLAMLLAQDTPYLLLDEPTTSLDPSGQFELMALLRTLADEGRAVALVIHDLPLALSGCDELWVMEKGRLAARGVPDALIRNGTLEEIFRVRLVPAGNGLYAMAGAPK